MPYEPFVQLKKLAAAFEKIDGGNFDYKSHIDGLVANFVGYCSEEERFFSKDELLQSAIETALKDEIRLAEKIRFKAINQGKALESEPMQKRDLHRSFNGFMQTNPDCCELNRSPFEPWLDAKLTGNYLVDIDVPISLYDMENNDCLLYTSDAADE